MPFMLQKVFFIPFSKRGLNGYAWIKRLLKD